MTHKLIKQKSSGFFIANALKTVIVEIPADAEVNKTASSCGDKNDTLNVVWGQGNCFELVFERVNSTYDLSSFVITLNVSSIFNDSSGQYQKNYAGHYVTANSYFSQSNNKNRLHAARNVQSSNKLFISL